MGEEDSESDDDSLECLGTEREGARVGEGGLEE